MTEVSKQEKRSNYQAWASMKQRCNNPNHMSYENYGGRGITVCDKWNLSYKDFLADMGYRPTTTHSLDRINNNGNYTPENCRWATLEQQRENKRPKQQSTRMKLRAEVKELECRKEELQSEVDSLGIVKGNLERMVADLKQTLDLSNDYSNSTVSKKVLKEHVKYLYTQGHNQEEIGVLVGKSGVTIGRWLKEVK